MKLQWAGKSLSIRARLTFWYLSVFSLSLLLFIAATTAVLYWQLNRQLTHFAIQDVETVEGLLYFAPDGSLQLNEDYHNHAQSRIVLERLLEVLSPDNRILYKNWRLANDTLGGPPIPGEGEGGYSPRSIRLRDGSSALVVSRRHVLQGKPILIRIGYREDSISSRIWEFLNSALTAFPILLALTAWIGYRMAGRSLEPIAAMARDVRQITAEDLARRLFIANADDEIGQLGRMINDLLDRLQHAFDQLKRFTSDASHELRTPLAAIRSVGEVSLQRDRSTDEYRDTIGSMLEEVGRLTTLIENLLTISRADAGQMPVSSTVFALHETVEEAVSLIGVLAEEKDQRIIFTDESRCYVRGDRLLLRQALVNILHNATKYSPDGSAIRISAEKPHDGWVSIVIVDNGPGIPPQHRDKIFERFYRIDEGRSRAVGGSGLGLSIANWSVQAQGGQLVVLDSRAGAAFAIRLQVGDPAEPEWRFAIFDQKHL